MIGKREYDALDRMIVNLDRALRAVAGVEDGTGRPSPGEAVAEGDLTPAERRHSAGLMRVDHAGEVAAQALYHGQAVTAHRGEVRAALDAAAAQEGDHLRWCRARLGELGARTSLLDPLWYAGSFALGALAGLAGDRASLGFLAETERQVVAHLDGHLRRLPPADARSRAVLARMREEEGAHAQTATGAGGRELPAPVRGAMRLASRVMTGSAYRI